VRSLSQEHGVSISTVQQAYQMLEQQQLITPQPRSGYFVAPRKAQPPVPPMSRPVQRPVEITQWDQVLTMLDARNDKSIIPFGGGSPDVTQPSLKPIWRELSRAIQHNLSEVLNYDELAGRRELREQIARLMLDGGSVVTATIWCSPAAATARCRWPCCRCASLAISSPWNLLLLRHHADAARTGLKTIEIPTDPETGISIEALELALDQWPIKGVILVPNCNNPLGFIMPDARKRAVLNLAQRHDIVIFEDDIYGELATEYPRPRTIHSWDIDGRVMLCSSLPKPSPPACASAGSRPGRYDDRCCR
jgi:DNA-binding transcriptional MocR family regulator